MHQIDRNIPNLQVSYCNFYLIICARKKDLIAEESEHTMMKRKKKALSLISKICEICNNSIIHSKEVSIDVILKQKSC